MDITPKERFGYTRGEIRSRAGAPPCTTALATGIGARICHQLDRHSETYKNLYKQRTATERINAQATALGIERLKLRNGAAIANLNTLIYVLINLRALQRVLDHKREFAS